MCASLGAVSTSDSGARHPERPGDRGVKARPCSPSPAVVAGDLSEQKSGAYCILTKEVQELSLISLSPQPLEAYCRR